MGQRIVIIGYSGSGKSTLAQKLGGIYNCEVLHLDCVHWLPGWKERDLADKNRIVSEFLDSHDSWVIDGNYSSVCYERRMSEATGIIFLDFPVYICLYRVIKRFLVYRGKSRASITEGCREKIDLEFLWWVLHRGRNKRAKNRYMNVCRTCADKVTVLKSPGDVKEFSGYCSKKS